MTRLDAEDPGLLAKIKAVLDQDIRGEDQNKQLLFLVCLSGLTRDPLSAVLKGSSGSGKSRLVKKVLKCFELLGMVMEFSRITPAYLDNLAKKNGGRIDLTGKIIYVAELKGIVNTQAPKLLISEGKLRLGTVINGQAEEIETVGTPVVISTTTLAALEDPEFENRILPLQIDESEEQTGEVLDYEADEFADPVKYQKDTGEFNELTSLVEHLQPNVAIAVPFAQQLSKLYPKKNVVARRSFPKFLRLISTIAFLHQAQRTRATKNGIMTIVADPQDLEYAKNLGREALRESLSGISSKELQVLSVVSSPMSIRMIREEMIPKLRRGDEWVRLRVKRLVEEGYLQKDLWSISRPFMYERTELKPDNLEVDVASLRTAETEWLDRYGYVAVESGSSVGFVAGTKESEITQTVLVKPETIQGITFGESSELDGSSEDRSWSTKVSFSQNPRGADTMVDHSTRNSVMPIHNWDFEKIPLFNSTPSTRKPSRESYVMELGS